MLIDVLCELAGASRCDSPVDEPESQLLTHVNSRSDHCCLVIHMCLFLLVA